MNDTSTTPQITTPIPPVTTTTEIRNETRANNSTEEIISTTPKYDYKEKLKDEWMILEIKTNIIDTIFVWFRYIHFTFVPLIIFLIHKVCIRNSMYVP